MCLCTGGCCILFLCIYSIWQFNRTYKTSYQIDGRWPGGRRSLTESGGQRVSISQAVRFAILDQFSPLLRRRLKSLNHLD
jgi:hypothetical protein